MVSWLARLRGAAPTLGLVVVALGLVAYVWLVEFGGEEGRAEAERASRRLLPMDADSVSELVLPLRGGGRARLVRDGERWRLEEPLSFPADGSVVKSALDTLANLESKSEIDPMPEDLAPFGLGEGSARVEIRLVDSEPLVLALGGETPILGSVYARLEGDGLHTVDLYASEALRPELKSLRESRVSALEADQVGAVRVLDGEDLVVAVERVETATAEGEEPVAEWRLLEPLEDRGDPVRIRRLIQDISLARATEFVDEPGALAQYGLQAPLVTIELTAGESRERIALGRDGETVYARRDEQGPVFRIHERTLDQVPLDVFAFRHKQVLTLEPLDVVQIELHFPRDGEARSFVRGEAGWSLAGAEDGDERVPPEQVEDLVYALEFVEATSIEEGEPDRAALGLDKPAVRVVALDSKGAELGWLELSDPVRVTGMPAVSSESERVWRVRNDLAESVPLGLAAYRSRWLVDDEEEEEEEPALPLAGQDLE